MKTLLLAFFILFSSAGFAEPYQTDWLFEAMEANDLEKAETMLKGGADPNGRRNYCKRMYCLKRLLNWAAANGSVETLELLLQHGADPNLGARWYEYEHPALYYAIKYGRLDIVKILLENNADIHGRDYLQIAYNYGWKDIVNYFENELGLKLED